MTYNERLVMYGAGDNRYRLIRYVGWHRVLVWRLFVWMTYVGGK